MASSGWQGQKNFPYNHTDIACDINITGITHSGNTLYVTGQVGAVYRGASGGYAYYYYPVYVNVENSGTQTLLAAYEHVSGTKTVDFSCSFECASDRTSAEIWVYVDMNNGTATGTLAWTLYFDSSYQQPGQPTVTIKEIYDNGAKFGVSGNYGIPSSASGRYIEAAILNQNTYGSTYRYNIASNTSSADITVTNTSYAGGGLNILGNKQYYYGGYINNTQGSNSKVTGQFITKPNTLNMYATKLYGDMAQLTWEFPADGGYYNKTLSYSVDGTNFTTIGTYSGTSARSGTEIVTGLTPNTQYAVYTMATTTAGTNSSTVSNFVTLPPEPTITQKSSTINSVTMEYSSPTDGGYYGSKTLAYTIDGGTTWVQGATIPGGSASSGTFTINNLEAGHAYNLIVRITTGAGTITLDDITITTLSDKSRLYGPKETTTTTGVTGEIRSGEAGNVTAFDGTTFFSAVSSQLDPEKTLKLVRVIKYDYTTYFDFVIDVYYTDNLSFNILNHGSASDAANYGITVTTNQSGGADYIDLTPITSTSYTNEIVDKFYGSVETSPSVYETVLANKIYGPVDGLGVDGEVRAGGSGNVTAFDNMKFMTEAKNKSNFWNAIQGTDDPIWLEIPHSGISDHYFINVVSSGHFNFTLDAGTAARMADYGITIISSPPSGGTDYIDLEKITTPWTKLVYQNFKHLTYPDNLWGTVKYYTETIDGYGKGPNSYNVNVYDIDQTKAANFVTDKNAKVVDHAVTMWWNSSSSAWSYETVSSGWTTITEYELRNTYGIDMYATSSSDARFDLADNIPIGADTSSSVATVNLLNETEFNGLGGTSTGKGTRVVTVGGNTIIMNQIKEFEGGAMNTSTPSYFLAYSSLDTVDFSLSPLSSVGVYAFAYSTVQSVSLPEGLSTIYADFMYHCDSYNAPMVIPNSVTTIGNYFMGYCSSFNSAITLPSNITQVGSNFLTYCTAFNKSLTLPNSLVLVNNSFMSHCESFNQPIDISHLTNIGSSFMNYCVSFNQSLTFNENVVFDGSVLPSCTSYNKNLTIPAGATFVSSGILTGANSYTSTITFNAPYTGVAGTPSGFSTTSTSVPGYTTGMTFAGPYAAEWRALYPDRTASPYRKIICADYETTYGVVYHYPHTMGWAQGTFLQNVTWEITNLNQFNQFTQQIGYSQSSTDQMYFIYQNGQWVCWYGGSSTQISDFPNQVGITVTSTHGGFQQDDGFSVFYGATVDTTGQITRTQLVSGDIARMIGDSSVTPTPKVYSIGNTTVCDQAIVSAYVGSNTTTIPNYFLKGAIRLKAVAFNESVTTIGNSVLRSTFDLNSPLLLASVTTIGDFFMYQGDFQYWSPYPERKFNSSIVLTNVTSIGNSFMGDNNNYNQTTTLSKLTSIGTYFMRGCGKFNNTLTISKIQTIGNYFLYNCYSFTRNLTIPNTATSIGTYFMYNCNAYVGTVYCNAAATVITSSNYSFATTDSSAACYTSGIKFGGTYKADWKTKFADRTSSPYRKITTI